MRATPTLLKLAVCLSSLAPLASAWPGWLPDIDSIVVRQDDGDSDSSSSAAETGATASATEADATSATGEPEETGDSNNDDEDDGDLNTARPTDEDDAKETKSPTTERKTKSIRPDAAVGGVNMQTPATTAVPTVLFKIGDNITFGWNYTGIQSEPTAIDVLLSCSTASETWTLTSNMSYTTNVDYIWNSEDQAGDVESPLLTEMYTLIIKDAEAEISDFPSAGKLGADAQFKFGLYHPVKYTPWPEWECTGCDKEASANFNAQAIKLAFSMSIITVFTFTWFVTGWGLQ